VLYDPKWEVPVKTKPDFAGFVAFAAAQAGDSTFNIDKPDECALGQYFQSLGERRPTLVSDAAMIFDMDAWDLYRVLWGSSGKPIQRFDSVAKRGRRKLFWQNVRRKIFG
jgi:hypothetical protein